MCLGLFLLLGEGLARSPPWGKGWEMKGLGSGFSGFARSVAGIIQRTACVWASGAAGVTEHSALTGSVRHRHLLRLPRGGPHWAALGRAGKRQGGQCADSVGVGQAG